MSPMESFDLHKVIDALARGMCARRYGDPPSAQFDAYWTMSTSRSEWEKDARAIIQTIEAVGCVIAPKSWVMANVEGADDGLLKTNANHRLQQQVAHLEAKLSDAISQIDQWKECAKLWERRHGAMQKAVHKATDDLSTLIGKTPTKRD